MPLNGIRACVFDAYGTLFDTSSVARQMQAALGPQWQALADLWRSKQLQYTWLRGLTGQHADFWQVTQDALDFAMANLGIQQPSLRDALMAQYLRIAAYPEVPDVLAKLKASGLQLAILSNGSPAMLAAATEHAAIGSYFDAVLSVESVGVYKPHPKVYALATEHFGLAKEAICFISSNGWDAYSAKAYGFQTLWCNRFAQAPERIPATPDGEMRDLAGLPDCLVSPSEAKPYTQRN